MGGNAAKSERNAPLRAWLNINEAAAYAGVCDRTIRYWIKKGLRHVRVGPNLVRIKPEWLDAWFENYEVDGNEVDRIVDDVMKGLDI